MSKVTSNRRINKEEALQRQLEEKEHSELMTELLIWVVLIVSIILSLCVFNLCGPLSNVFGALLFGLFGFPAYVFPILLFFSICFYKMNSNNKKVVRRVVCSWILYINIAAIIQLLTSDQPDNLFACYTYSYKYHAGGGFLGACVSKGLTAIIGSLASGILLFITAIMLIAFITGKMIASLIVEKSASKYNDYVAEVREQRRIKREENADIIDYDDYIIEDNDDTETEKKPAAIPKKRFSYKFPDSKPAKQAKPEKTKEDIPASDNTDIETAHVEEEVSDMEAVNDDIPVYEKEIKEKFGSEHAANDSSLELLVARALENDRVQYSEFDPYVEEYHEGDNNYNEIPEETEEYNDVCYNDNIANDNYSTDDYSIDDYSTEITPDNPVHNSQYEQSSTVSDIITDYTSTENITTENIAAELDVTEQNTYEHVTAEHACAKQNTNEHATVEHAASEHTASENASNESVNIEMPPEPIPYSFPPLDLLERPSGAGRGMSENELKETAKKLQDCLKSFKVEVKMTDIICGPTVTRYELQPSLGTRVKKITELENDIKLNLAASDIRIEAPIPGKSAVGIEVPNPDTVTITLREMLETKEFRTHKSDVAFGVGKDIGGHNIVADIAKMPHMLIAGSTGSGKSVCINTIVMSLLYKADPNDVKLIMVDPKVVELSIYNGIPHLCIPVVTDPKKAAAALNWAVAEMEERYNKFAKLGARNIKGYNDIIDSLKENPDMYVKMPHIIIIVDELADLMMVASHDVETAICRLAQKARAAGLHLILATQRPSVDVITGLIKNNVPSRIAFAVSSAIDSRTILDGAGAEKLLGKGDMLFYPQGLPKPIRVQGAFVSDAEVARVTDYVKNQYDTPVYDKSINEKIINTEMNGNNTAAEPDTTDANPNGWDEKFEEAGRFIIEKQKASIGTLQRVFKIGFNRGARIMDQLCEAGVVGEEDGKKPRNILMTMEEFERLIQEGR